MRKTLSALTVLFATVVMTLGYMLPAESRYIIKSHRTGKQVPGSSPAAAHMGAKPAKAPPAKKKPVIKKYGAYPSRGSLYGAPGEGYVPKTPSVGTRGF